MKKVLLILIVIFAGICLCRRDAQAGGIPVIDTSNLAQSVLSAARTLQSNLNEARMIANQIKNLTALDFNILEGYSGNLTKLFETMGSVHGLMQDLSSLEANFETLYPDFNNDPARVSEEKASETINRALDESRRMMQGAAKTGAIVLQNLPKTEAELEELLADSKTSVGILQATQAGNQINAEVASNLLHLNAMLANFTQAHMAYMQKQNTAEAIELNKSKHFFSAEKESSEDSVPMNPF